MAMPCLKNMGKMPPQHIHNSSAVSQAVESPAMKTFLTGSARGTICGSGGGAPWVKTSMCNWSSQSILHPSSLIGATLPPLGMSRLRTATVKVFSTNSPGFVATSPSINRWPSAFTQLRVAFFSSPNFSVTS